MSIVVAEIEAKIRSLSGVVVELQHAPTGDTPRWHGKFVLTKMHLFFGAIYDCN